MDAYKRKIVENYLDWDTIDTSLLTEVTEQEAKQGRTSAIDSGYLCRGGKYYKKALNNDNALEDAYQAMMDRAPAKIYDEITKISTDVHKIRGWVVHFAVNTMITAFVVAFLIWFSIL